MITEPIDSKIEKSIENISRKFTNCKRVKEFESSIEVFEQLVRQGVAHKRGNNLLSLTDAHLKNIKTNTAHNESAKLTGNQVLLLDVDSTHYNARNW